LIAATGHTSRQAPHPVQSSARTSTWTRPPSSGRNRSAAGLQADSQVRQATPLLSRQAEVISALTLQGVVPSRSSRNAPLLQISAHAPQKVQLPRAKSILARPSVSATIMSCGQALRQSPQLVQDAGKDSSASAQGGRKGASRPPRRRKKSRRFKVFPQFVGARSFKRSACIGP